MTLTRARRRVTLASRNVHDLVFRIVELGVVLWFPCVLWNSIRYGLTNRRRSGRTAGHISGYWDYSMTCYLGKLFADSWKI